MGKGLLILLVVCSAIACSNDTSEVDALFSESGEGTDVIEEVEILYSDSAVVKVRIIAPRMLLFKEGITNIEEFPDGLQVEFINKNKQAYSWLKADYAIRNVLDKQIITQKNVELKNRYDERILTNELIWDETNEVLFTEKYVKIIQPASQDTTEGFGFKTNQEFTVFEIKKRGLASINADRLKKELQINP